MNTTPNSSTVIQPASVPPTRPAAPAKRGRLFYLGLVGVIAGCLCCSLSLVLVVLSYTLGK